MDTENLGGREPEKDTNSFGCHNRIQRAQPSKKQPKLLVSFSGSRPPKLSFSPAIKLERASSLVVMNNDSLRELEPENKTDNFDDSSL